MGNDQGIRTTHGRGRLFDSVLDTIGDTPVIRVNNIPTNGATIYVKAEAFNPGGSVKNRLASEVVRPIRIACSDVSNLEAGIHK